MNELGKVNFDYLLLKDVHLEPCRGCFLCLSKGKEHCPLKDDRDDILKRMLAADGIIMASPVYVMNVSGLIKNFIDRMAFICHRPRFFTRHAMVVSTTGNIGLRSVLKYLTGVCRTWMFRSVTTLGLVTPPQSLVTEKLKKGNAKKTASATAHFYRRLKSTKPIAPGLKSLIQFRIQRVIFTFDETREDMPADHEFYRPLHEQPFYVDAKINPLKNLIAWLVEKIAAFQIKRMFK
jgi:NAD(P)H-dependent FMN reductase